VAIDPNTLNRQRVALGLAPLPRPPRKNKPTFARCDHEGCRRKVYAKGKCKRHWGQVREGHTQRRLASDVPRAWPKVIERARARLAAKGIVVEAA
jgi:hypothetical protein